MARLAATSCYVHSCLLAFLPGNRHPRLATVIPANAGIHKIGLDARPWIPACAGMTMGKGAVGMDGEGAVGMTDPMSSR